ncbi:unnamed protein product, partial [marine sediment metagenome]
MAGLKSILINMVVLGILIFGIMSWIIIIQSDGDVSPGNKILNNSLINESFGDLQTSLDQQSASQGSLDSLEDVPPTEYIGDLDVGSVVSTTRTTKDMVTGLWNIYIKLPMVILGVSPIVA